MQKFQLRFRVFVGRAERGCIVLDSIRHTFASLLIQNGESLTYVKEQLGHSSIKITVDVYGHLVPGANRQAVNRLPSLHGLQAGKRNVKEG